MKYALITGSTKGIGKAVSEKLLIEGYFVFVNYFNDDIAASNIFEEFVSKYGENMFLLIKADLSKFESINLLFEEVNKITNHIDVLIINAGVTDRSSFETITIEKWQSVIQTNLSVPVFIVQKFVSMMSFGGSIIFTGSLMGEKPHSMSLAYGVSKTAIHSLVRNLVKFLEPYSLRVNAIAPGFVDTEWQKEKPKEIRESIEKKIAMRKFGSTIEIAKIYWSIIDNEYINGQIIIIDGGYDYK